MAIEAIGRAQASGANIGFVQIGDGMARKAVERAAAKVPHVVLKGHVGDRDTLASMLASGDALLHASSSETYGLAVAEALAAGLPLVAPAGGAVLDLLSPEWSESYPPHPAGAAAAASRRFLRRDRDAMAAAAAHAGATVVGDSDAHFKRLFATYARLVDEHAARRRRAGDSVRCHRHVC